METIYFLYMGEIDAKNRLEQLFVACDKNGSGFIGRCELRDLCAGLGLGCTEADALFADLDRNGDGRIDLEDFAAGFREFVLVRPEEPMTETTNTDVEKKRKQVLSTWKQIDAITGHFL
uniref:EF-hand domain-containing protein n=1 Tax=Strigamia maritima TaxID=126957 RepID=T1JN85_STRMM